MGGNLVFWSIHFWPSDHLPIKCKNLNHTEFSFPCMGYISSTMYSSSEWILVLVSGVSNQMTWYSECFSLTKWLTFMPLQHLLLWVFLRNLYCFLDSDLRKNKVDHHVINLKDKNAYWLTFTTFKRLQVFLIKGENLWKGDCKEKSGQRVGIEI